MMVAVLVLCVLVSGAAAQPPPPPHLNLPEVISDSDEDNVVIIPDYVIYVLVCIFIKSVLYLYIFLDAPRANIT